MSNIFLLEDQLVTCKIVAELFRSHGYDLRYGHIGSCLFDALANWSPDLVILDIELAAEDGRAIARRLREFSNVPILMLSGRSDIQTRLQSFDLGADDYLCKPFDNRELLARARALLRRSLPPPSATNGGVVLDPALQALRIGKADLVMLTGIEYRLLEVLMAQPGQTVSREVLCRAALRRGWAPNDRTIDVHFSNLRRKLNELAAGVVLIKAIRGVGYRFTFELDRIEDDPS